MLNHDQLLRLIRDKMEHPATPRELQQRLKIPREGRATLTKLLKELTRNGSLVETRGNRYGLMVTLPPAFPDEPPACYITDPSPLPSKEGNLNELTYNSHEMHCWIPDKEGYVKICTYKPENWSADHSIEKVIQKALLWIEAYESHLATGKPISKFLMDVTH